MLKRLLQNVIVLLGFGLLGGAVGGIAVGIITSSAIHSTTSTSH